MVTLSIIILSFNTKEQTIQCIQSLKKHYKQELDAKEFEIIVLDNASQDGSFEALKKISDTNSFYIFSNTENEGFAKGINKASQKARGEFLFFLNSDTLVQNRGLKKMLEYFNNNEKIAVIGGKLYNKDNSSQASAGKFYNISQVLLFLLGIERFGLLRKSPNHVTAVDWVSGAAFMTRKKVFESLGGFDKAYFMYIEDMDFCYRAKKAGYTTMFCPDMTIKHIGHASSDRSFAIVNIYKGLLHFYKKLKPKWEYAVVKEALRIKAYIGIIIGMLLGSSYLADTYKKALRVTLL